MKKISGIIMLLSAVIFILPAAESSSSKTIHFFESAVCPACKKASAWFADPANKKNFEGVRIVKYELLSGSGKMNDTNRKNIRTLVTMLEGIKKRKGSEPFIFQERLPYEYHTKNGLPYYKREERYSRKDEPIPVPFFIVNDRAYVGFSPFVSSSILKDLR